MTERNRLNIFDDEIYEPTRAADFHDENDVPPSLQNQITLFHQRATPQVKTFERMLDGTISSGGFTSAFKAKPLVYIVNDLLELHLFLIWVEEQSGSVVLRGKPLVTGRKIRRLIHAKDRQKATFEDVPRSWLCLDVDTLPIPPGLSYACPADLAEYTVSLLPRAHFWNVSFIWQLSSSAGLKKSNLIKLHLWFWLDAPQTSADLREWAKSLGGLIDHALYNPVQPHITARPIFVGMEDPFETRTGIILRRDPAVRGADQLRAPATTAPRARRACGDRRKNPRRVLDPNSDDRSSIETAIPGDRLFAGWPAILHAVERTQTFHNHIWRLLLSYFGRGGSNIPELKDALRLQISLGTPANEQTSKIGI